MALALAVLALLLSLISLAVVGLVLRSRRRPSPAAELLAEHLHDQLVVTLTDGQSFRGLLGRVDDKSVILRDVVILPGGPQETTPVDGELILPRPRIAYIQRP